MFDYTLAINQLTNSSNGFNRLKCMISASNFVTDNDNNSICFKFKGNPTIKYCTIILDSTDLYTLKFSNCKGNTVKECSGLFFDQMKETFEQTTKLYLSL